MDQFLNQPQILDSGHFDVQIADSKISSDCKFLVSSPLFTDCKVANLVSHDIIF